MNNLRNSVNEMCATGAWALDFIRALNERPVLMKLLFRIVVGKFAYREFIGCIDNLRKAGDMPFFEYELKGMDYHQEKLPWSWWKR